ncbi:MAG: hypothetical protein B6U78_00595 [Candidatus Aenigmarchaeota archaeon ex4484_224]|nr:MAG: hypothetical protein B6U78_00595 [Candidatus Aenigmarchaeota archaeon ex4484_224]
MERDIYPEGPFPDWSGDLKPGTGINVVPLNQNILLNYTGPPGSGTAAYYKISTYLPKRGFVRYKLDEWIYVSPVNKPYFDLTISQREELQNKIKAHLASIANAISDLELGEHDLRKYKEYMDYFNKIEEGKKLIKEGKEEEGKKLILEGNQTLRSIFIDMVDVHTGEGISMRSIAIRWPTIISDFMKLNDEDIDPKKIAEKLQVTEAEGVILATKNKLFVEWKKMFFETVKNRYQRLLSLVNARRASVEEYKKMVKPLIARYKMISDALESPNLRATTKKLFFRPDAQAFSIDFMRIWAWRPILPYEKYRPPTESPSTTISLEKAGFTKKEIEYIKKIVEAKGETFKNEINALPIPKAVDSVLRDIVKRIEKKYQVIITPYDVYEAIKELSSYYTYKIEETQTHEIWPFSPYFVFLDIPIMRTMIKLPNGAELEDFEINTFKAYLKTQNIILGHMLELKAIDKKLEKEIGLLLGEFGLLEGKEVEISKVLSSEYPLIFQNGGFEQMSLESSEEVGKIKKTYKVEKTIQKFSSILNNLGWQIAFFAAKTPYEHAFKDRFTKFYFNVTAIYWLEIIGLLNSHFKVPL